MYRNFSWLVRTGPILFLALLWLGVQPAEQMPSDVNSSDDPFVFIHEGNLEAEAESQSFDELGLIAVFDFSPFDFSHRVTVVELQVGVAVAIEFVSCRGPPAA